MTLLSFLPAVFLFFCLWRRRRHRRRRPTKERQRELSEVASLVCKLKRLRILGCCAAGKSNLRKCLAEVLQLPAVEMDSIYWKPGWVMRHPDETLDLLTQRTQEDAWIVDGNFMSKPRDLDRSELNRWLWEKTQCVVWLDYPFWTIYLRAWRRTLWRISTGEPCCNGNRETWSLLLCDFRNSIPYFVWTTHAQLAQRVQQLEHIFEGKLHFVALRSQAETNYFLHEIAANLQS